MVTRSTDAALGDDELKMQKTHVCMSSVKMGQMLYDKFIDIRNLSENLSQGRWEILTKDMYLWYKSNMLLWNLTILDFLKSKVK